MFLLKFYFYCSTQEQLLVASIYNLGSYHTNSHTALISEYSNNLTASLEAHTFLNKQRAASSSCNNSFNNKIKYKAGNHSVHVSVYFPNITQYNTKLIFLFQHWSETMNILFQNAAHHMVPVGRQPIYPPY